MADKKQEGGKTTVESDSNGMPAKKPRRKGSPMPGERRGGRAKGTPNKKTQDVIEKLAAIGCDPILGMAKIAMDENNDISLRASMYKELAKYTTPQRKAIEVTTTETPQYQWVVNVVADA